MLAAETHLLLLHWTTGDGDASYQYTWDMIPHYALEPLFHSGIHSQEIHCCMRLIFGVPEILLPLLRSVQRAVTGYKSP